MVLIIILVLLGLALIAVFVNREKDEEKARLAIMGLTVAILVVAIMSILGVGKGGGAAQFDTSVDRAVGEVSADRIAGVATGSRVVLIVDSRPHNPFAKSRADGFIERLAAHHKEVVGTQDPWPRDGDLNLPEEGLSSWGIEQALRNFPEADVIVSLAGFPTHGFDEVVRDLQKVEFFAIDENYLTDWVPYVRQGALKGLIVPPYDANWSDTSGTPEEVFDRRYVFVNAQNLAEMTRRFQDPYDYQEW